MKVGGVRRLIVPVELGYPGQPPDFTKLGPTPGNFSVQTQLSIRQAFGLCFKGNLFLSHVKTYSMRAVVVVSHVARYVRAIRALTIV